MSVSLAGALTTEINVIGVSGRRCRCGVGQKTRAVAGNNNATVPQYTVFTMLTDDIYIYMKYIKFFK
jgi:hypothetical protein